MTTKSIFEVRFKVLTELSESEFGRYLIAMIKSMPISHSFIEIKPSSTLTFP